MQCTLQHQSIGIDNIKGGGVQVSTVKHLNTENIKGEGCKLLQLTTWKGSLASQTLYKRSVKSLACETNRRGAGLYGKASEHWGLVSTVKPEH